MIVHSLDSIFAQITAADHELGEALQRFHHNLIEFNPEPSYKVVSYPYGTKIFERGKPKIVSLDASLQAVLGIDYSLPLGVILTGQAEVIDYVRLHDIVHRMPQAILQSGDFIGLFEFVDQLILGVPPARPDWTITSGLTTIQPAFDTQTAHFRDHLRRKIGTNVGNHSSFFDLIMRTPTIHNEISRYEVTVFFIGADWFRTYVDSSIDYNENFANARRELISVLLARAWRSASRIRPISNNIDQYFESVNTRHSTAPEINRQYRIAMAFRYIYDCYIGRRPILTPEREDGEWGPFGYLCRSILFGYADNNNHFILRPEYLHKLKCNVGYISTDDVGYCLTGKSIKDGLHEIIVCTLAAAAAERQESGGSILQSCDRLLQAMAIRVPSDGRVRKKAILSYRLLCSEDAHLEFKEISDDEFSCTNENLLGGAHGFFKNAIRFYRDS